VKKITIVVLSVLTAGLVFSLLPFKTSGHASKFVRSANPFQGHYIVVLNDDILVKDVAGTNGKGRLINPVTKSVPEDPTSTDIAAPDDSSIAADALSATYGGKINKVYGKALKGYAAEMSDVEAQALSQDPRVKYVEEDGVMAISTVEQAGATWGLDRADQRNLPLNGLYDFNQTGAGENAYVIDTGIRTTHLEFGGRADMVYNAINDGNTGDCNGHGTHVSGTIGGSTFGVAKGVSLHGVRVLDCAGNGTTSGVIAGVDWVTRHGMKPAVVNMSLNGSATQALDDAITSSIAAGFTYVVAAGNANWDACTFSPSRVQGAITVAASDNLDQSAWFTNWGTCVDIFAPGVNITSAWGTGDNLIATISGTSMASPHVAGAAALYLETNRTASPSNVSGALVAGGTTNMLKNVYFGSPNLLLYTQVAANLNLCGLSEKGTILKQGQMDYQSSVSGFSGGAGNYTGVLSTPPGTQFGLALERKKGMKWNQVAGTTIPNALVSYNGNSGVYRWRITGILGTGDYGLCTVNP